MCVKHYTRSRRNMPLADHLYPAGPGRPQESQTCTVGKCGRPAYAHSWCQAHYRRWVRHGDVQAHKPLAAPRGPQGRA